MKDDQESIQQKIRETVSLLCRNSLSHSLEVRIQGLIGITVDNSDVMLVQFDESYANEHNKQENIDSTSAVSVMAEQRAYNPRKRRRLKQTAAATLNIAPDEQFADDEDGEVVFIADERDNDVKLGFDKFCSSVNTSCNCEDIDNNSPVFKSDENFASTDPNIDINNAAVQNGHCKGNGLLRNMLADQNDNMTEQVSDWQTEETTAQTTHFIKHEQTAIRPPVKQVIVRLAV